MVNQTMMKKKTVQRVCRIVAGVVIVGVVAAGGYMWLNQPERYTMMQASSTAIEETLSVMGNVKSNETKTYYAMFTAPIVTLEAEKGKTVTAGEQLVAFDTKDLSLAAKQSALAVRAAENQYQSTVNQNEKNMLIYQGATMSEANFFELIEEQRDVIKDLQEKVSRAANKQNDIAVLQNRVSMEVDPDDKDDLQATLDMWKGEYKNMNAPEKEAELAKQQTRLNDMETYRSQYESQRQTADNQMIDASAQEEILTNKESAALSKQKDEETLEEASDGLQADYDGIISEVYVEEGATVQKGTALFKLEDSNDMAVEAMISKYDIDKVTLGQRAKIAIAANTYNGTITKIDQVTVTDTSDKAKVPVTVTIEKPDARVYLGIEADVDINIASKESALTIPTSAVYSGEEGEYCYQLKGGAVQKTMIETGLANSTLTEVTSGIELGDKVITDAVTEDKIGVKAVEEASATVEGNANENAD